MQAKINKFLIKCRPFFYVLFQIVWLYMGITLVMSFVSAQKDEIPNEERWMVLGLALLFFGLSKAYDWLVMKTGDGTLGE